MEKVQRLEVQDPNAPIWSNGLWYSLVQSENFGSMQKGDTVSCKPVWSKEANADAEKWIRSNGYFLNISGKTMRPLEKDFVLCQYNITKSDLSDKYTKDCNKTMPKYAV